MIFRRIAEAELPALLDLRVQAARWLWDKGIPQWHPDGFTLENTYEDFERHRLYSLWDGETLVGSFRLQDSDPVLWPEAQPGEALYLHTLVVARERAGTGIGDHLLDQAFAIAAAEGYPYLRLDCYAGNAALRGYYEARGFAFHSELAEETWTVARFEKATR
ncbi:MAG: GNAT family N-acetyltransferase [Armatimonas sp.]